jgi:long-chain acyl-CoA synthetase
MSAQEICMDYEASPNLVHMFLHQVLELGDKPFLWAKRSGKYRAMSWLEAADAVGRLAQALTGLGIQPGDRVVLVSENRPEWPIADLAIMAAGGITVPAYTTNTEHDHRHIINNSGAKGAIVSTARLADRLLPAAHESDSLKFLIAMEPPELAQAMNVDIHSWFGLTRSSRSGMDTLSTAAESLNRDDTACIIYTSGTGGAPKGVMLHHGAILHNCRGAYDALLDLGLNQEVFLSFLPLSHSYEHTAGLYFPISIGGQIYYAEGVDSLLSNLAEVHPTLMTAVPRLYEMMYARMMRAIETQGGYKLKLFQNTLAMGDKRRQQNGELSLYDALYDRLLDRLVRNKIRIRFGGSLKAMVSGGAPLNPEIGYFFTSLGLRIVQGYGQTEAAPLITVNPPMQVKMDTVGTAVTGVEMRLADDGEILARGEMVMQGYWGNPDATAEVIQDGWLHTGDIGEIDHDGYLRITDRKKDIIVNSGGDNLSPQRVEGMLTLETEISQAMVYGDRRSHLVALLVPDSDWSRNWAREMSLDADPHELAKDEFFHKVLSEAVDRVNSKLSNIERIRRFIITCEPFSIENKQMTPSMKIRRHILKEEYGERLDALYS